MNREIIMVNISELKSHPENEKIYGADEDVQSLQKSILEDGLRNFIKINESNVIISGHRRWQAFKNLVAEGHKEFNEIPCQVLHFENEEDELECLVIENDTSSQRHKTIEQETRELMVYKEIEAIRAKKRMSLGGKGGIGKENEGTPNSADVVKGETREVLFQKYGDRYNLNSSRDVDKRIKSVEKADSLRKSGETEKSALIISVLNKNKASQAYDLSNAIDKLTNDTIQKIIEGKISVGKAIKDAKENNSVSNPALNTKSISPEEQAEAIEAVFLSEMHSSRINADVLITHLNEISRICSDKSLFPYYPKELKSAVKSTISTLNRNLKYIYNVNELANIPLIKEIMPICKLDFWKKLSCFTVKNSECYSITDDVIFTILRSLALITNASCWMEEDLDGNYNYIYNNNEAMLNFAKAFKVQEDGAITENLVTLYKQFNNIIEEINDLSSRDWKFFDECNLPHIISMLDYFNSLEREDILFKDILIQFFKSGDKKEYQNRIEYESEEYDMTYAEPNIEARIDFLKDCVDDYIDSIDVENEEDAD